MMQDKRFFVYSVIIALAVPAIIGTLYFCKLSKEYSKDSYIAKMSNNEELLILGDTYRNVINDNTKTLEFLVTYAGGEVDFLNYRLDLESSNSLKGLNWHLYREKDEEYEELSSGRINGDTLSIAMIPYNSIKLRDVHKYKLYVNSKETIKGVNIELQEE